ncbi:DUF6096 family protein [Clostridium sp. HBUAS56017]|uniref:DUF6096 family protein n=1 Tax=Clostridium sp. HBUAS56017 TaxID=2571128 RepID=UPI0011774F8F|nr:DUF6096 family protein [Clostridium sp. HBUAS56017]
MLYKELRIGDKELKLRLRARDCVALESNIGESPLNKLMECQEGKVPEVGFLISVLHSSLQAFEHGYTLDKTYDLYDEYVEGGGTVVDLLTELINVFEVSGFFKQEEIKEETKKKSNSEKIQV